MEPEPSPAALLKAITALTASVGSLQDQIRAQSQQITELRTICKETANLLSNKDQGGTQAQPGPLAGPAPFRPSRGTGFDSEEEEEPRRPKKEPQGTPGRHLGSLTPFNAGSSVKRPKMDLPDPYKGDTRGRKATQWLDRMMLWVALHRDQFDEEEQMLFPYTFYVPEADDLATQMETQWQEIKAALQQSKTRMVAGETGEPLNFEIREEAWLDAKNVKLKTLSPKLTKQRLGPFKVIEKISNQAYRLKLPPTMRIHNVFYVGLLSKVKRDDKCAFKNHPPPVTMDGEEEYKVEGITDMEERDGEWYFRVKWKGYGLEENTWEPQENLKNAGKILKKYEEEMRKKALGAAKALKGGAVL
ncbi:Chromo (CHRromatin Organization MOdifier) domain, partial [Rhizoctonia solani]